MVRCRHRRDAGFTLVEMLVTLSVVGVMSGVAVASFSSWAAGSEHRAARDEVVSVLRNAGERALSEGRTYCVELRDARWTTYRFACDPTTGAVVAGPTALESQRVTLTPALTAPTGLADACPADSQCAYFYPRGNSSSGTVTVGREGRSPYTVTIVGLTSRVFSS